MLLAQPPGTESKTLALLGILEIKHFHFMVKLDRSAIYFQPQFSKFKNRLADSDDDHTTQR